ncbi:MAG: NADH-quinone oxidoreductase subunit L [Syntrophomonadaceae bacterium]|nr:NADH-quinone oxidoreductase subunit L [Syntrophomonadaceae bacterium]
MTQFAIDNSWLIPFMPALAFIMIVFFLRKAPQASALFSIACIFTSFVLALGVVGGILANPTTTEHSVTWFSMPGVSLEMGTLIDPISGMMVFVVTLIALLVQIYSIGYMENDPGYSTYFAYQSLFAMSMLGLVVSNNFLQMFVFWELVGLCSYLLIGFWFYKHSAREAAKKAFITNRVGDFGFLLGILFLQILFGTLNFTDLADIIPTYTNIGLLTVVALLVFAGPIGKSGQFPLHVWLPDAMEGPTPVSALIHAATMVVAGVYLIARAFFLFVAVPNALMVIAYVGGFTAFFAATIAITQNDIKRILAYSTLSQLGYMVMALGVGGLTASMFHLMTHAFFKALLFLGAGSVIHALHNKQDIWEMGGLAPKMPVTTKTFVIAALALAGIFPLAGFWSKDEILLAALSNGYTGLYLIGTFVAFLTAFYMFRLVFVAFYGEPNPENHPHESPKVMTVPLIVLACLSVVGGLVGMPWLKTNFGSYIYFGEAHHGYSLSIMLTSTLVALAGIYLAYLMYYKKTISAEAIAHRFQPIYKLLYNKYYIDEIYQWFINRVVDGAGRVAYWVDLYVVDGVVNGLANGTKWGGYLVRYLQTGQTQHYGMVLIAAVVVIVILLGLIDPSMGIFAGGGAK